MDSEDDLFVVYTSGTTNNPKRIAHSQAGYLLYAAFTRKVYMYTLIGDKHLFASSKIIQPALYCMYKYPGQLEQINIQVKICCMYIELNTNFTFFLVVHF